MEKIKISDLELDEIPEINAWSTRFKDDPRFSSIMHYILEDNTYYGLDEVICTNYEEYPIGDQERKYALSVKNEDGEVIAFILACMINLHTLKPELIIQYIVLRPDYQYQGYGYKILSDIVLNSEFYFGAKPHHLSAIIEKTNKVSQKLFSKMGCSFKRFSGTTYYRAEGDIPEPNNQKEDE